MSVLLTIAALLVAGLLAERIAGPEPCVYEAQIGLADPCDRG